MSDAEAVRISSIGTEPCKVSPLSFPSAGSICAEQWMARTRRRYELADGGRQRGGGAMAISEPHVASHRAAQGSLSTASLRAWAETERPHRIMKTAASGRRLRLADDVEAERMREAIRPSRSTPAASHCREPVGATAPRTPSRPALDAAVVVFAVWQGQRPCSGQGPRHGCCWRFLLSAGGGGRRPRRRQ